MNVTTKRAFSPITRRQLLAKSGLMLGATCVLQSPAILAKTQEEAPKTLHLYNVNTRETIETTFWKGGEYNSEGLHELNYFMRDFRTTQTYVMDPLLYDLLHSVRQKLPGKRPVYVMSGYRSPETNARLRKNSSKVATKSYHMKGQAMDICFDDQSLKDLRKTALAMRAGGVGYYPKSGFVHIDTGRVRGW